MERAILARIQDGRVANDAPIVAVSDGISIRVHLVNVDLLRTPLHTLRSMTTLRGSNGICILGFQVLKKLSGGRVFDND